MTHAVNDWRPSTFYEQSILNLLLQTQFEGGEAIRTQLTDFEVRTISGFGSIAIRSKSTVQAKVNHRVPVEAYALDIDGNAIHYLLHVVAGVANELEVYTDTTDCPLSKLATGEFVRRNENVTFVGKSGLGKTHIIEGLGKRCCVAG